MANKNLKYFMREESKQEQIFQVPAPERFKDDKGEVVQMEIKKLHNDAIARIKELEVELANEQSKTEGDSDQVAQLEAEVELKESQGQLHKLKTAIAEGKYIPADQAAEELAEFMAMFKKFALNIPPRTVGTLSGYADALTIRTMEKAMRKELETMLTAFSDAAIEQRQEEP